MPYTISLTRRKNGIPQTQLHNAHAVYDFARRHVIKKKDAWRESCHLLTLDKRNNLKGIFLLSLGNEHETVLDDHLAARVAVLDGADQVILVHNHPGGDPTPSGCDNNMTERLRRAPGCVSVSLIDHVIISENAFYSFSDERTTKTS